MAEYGAFGAAAAAVMRGGAALYPTSTGDDSPSGRRQGRKGRDDRRSLSPETSEVLTGFYQFECSDLDEAVKWAAQIPAAWTGRSRFARSSTSVPVRPDTASSRKWPRGPRPARP